MVDDVSDLGRDSIQGVLKVFEVLRREFHHHIDVCPFLVGHNKDELDHTSLRQARMQPAVVPAVHSKAKAASIATEITESRSGLRKGKLVVCLISS